MLNFVSIAQETGDDIILADRREEPRYTSYRMVLIYRGLMAIVKHFGNPDETADKFSVKFYHDLDNMAKVMSYWHTIEMLNPDSDEYRDEQKTMKKYFFDIIRRIQK